jgi:hypothetical protein
MKYFSPSFEVNKLLIVANKIGYNFALVVIIILEDMYLFFNLIAMGAKSKEMNILEKVCGNHSTWIRLK